MQILLPKVSSVSVSNKDCVHQVGGRMTMLMLLFLGTTLLQRLANLCAPTAWELSSLFLLHIFMSRDINLIQSGMIHPHYLHSAQHSAKTRVLHLIRTRYLAQTHLSTLSPRWILYSPPTHVSRIRMGRVSPHTQWPLRVSHTPCSSTSPQSRPRPELRKNKDKYKHLLCYF